MVLGRSLCSLGDWDGTIAEIEELAPEARKREIGRMLSGERVTPEALKHAGGRRRRGEQGAWGDELKSLADAKPGDILQFEGAVFVRTRFREDGAKVTEMSSFPHHTAIIARVRKRGTKPILVVLHQNVGDSQIVHEWTIIMADKKRGTVKGYKPVAD